MGRSGSHLDRKYQVLRNFSISIVSNAAMPPPKTPMTYEDSSSNETLPEVRISAAKTDGGWIAWSQVLVSHLLVINGFGYISSFSLFQSHWGSTFNRSASDIAWVGSLQLFLLFFVGTLSGRAMDAGYFRSLIYVGCSMQLLGVFTTSAVSQYWQLVLSQGIVQGVGNGILFTPAVALVSTYFMKRRAFALGIAACGAPVGGVIFPIVSCIYWLFSSRKSAYPWKDCPPTYATDQLRLGHPSHGLCHAPQHCPNYYARSSSIGQPDQRPLS